MNKALLLTGLCLTFFASGAQTDSLQFYYTAAMDAHKAGDHKKFYTMVLKAHTFHPHHQGILYQAGIAAALNNKPEESVRYLKSAIQIKADFNLAHPELKALEGREDFKKLNALQTALQQKIIRSDTAFILKDRSLHIESIARGESKNIFYLGSIHKRKILRIDEKGSLQDFTTSGQDGLCSVFGIKADTSRMILWACSSPLPEMENFDSAATSAVYKYDIRTGKLLGKYSPETKKKFIFGDLTLDTKGNVFVSDSRNNIIFMVNEDNNTLENYFTSEEFRSLQGMALSPDNRYLFIADYVRGIFRLDIKDKSLLPLEQQFEATTKSIDGLTYYNNSLIAIQNLIYPMRVTRYMLNSTQDKLTDYKIIDRGHPAFNEPTIGCLVKDAFYYIANSQWSGYDAQHKIKPVEQLQDVVILKAELKEE